MARNHNDSTVTAGDIPVMGISGTLDKDPPPIYRAIAQLLGDPTAADDDDRRSDATASDH